MSDTPEQTAEQPQQEKRQALVLNEEQGYIIPTSMGEAFGMAQSIVAANFAPSSYNSDPKKVALGLMAAMEAGLPPLYGLRNIAIINGRPTMWGDALLALVQSKNLVAAYHTEQIGTKPTENDVSKWPDDYGYRVTLKRRGQEGEYVGEFTVGHAKRAKLWMNAQKKPWLEHPERMLLNRARAFPLRDGFADALGGIAVREEIEDTFGEEKALPEVHLKNEPLVAVPPMPSGDADDAQATDNP